MGQNQLIQIVLYRNVSLYRDIQEAIYRYM